VGSECSIGGFWVEQDYYFTVSQTPESVLSKTTHLTTVLIHPSFSSAYNYVAAVIKTR
jgi:hypothetical protein